MDVHEHRDDLSVVRGTTLWSFDGVVSRAVMWFGALDDESHLPDRAPCAQFLKYSACGSVSRAFETFAVRTASRKRDCGIACRRRSAVALLIPIAQSTSRSLHANS